MAETLTTGITHLSQTSDLSQTEQKSAILSDLKGEVLMYSNKVTYTNHQNSFPWALTSLSDRIPAAHEECLRFDDRKRPYRLMRHRICSEWVVNGFRNNTIRKITRSDTAPGALLIVLYFQILIRLYQKWSQRMKTIYSSLKTRVNAL